MSWIIIPKAQAALYRKRKITWFHGIDAVELKNGDFVLSDRVINDMKRFPAKNREIILSDETKSTLDLELGKLPTQENPIFKESDLVIL